MRIVCATPKDFARVRAFYHFVIDRLEETKYDPAWRKGIYPSDAYLHEALKHQELYIGFFSEESDDQTNEKIIAAMIVNQQGNEDYKNAHWTKQIASQKIMVLHALGVHPDHMRQGIAKQMVQKVFALAKEKNLKAVRLDVLKGNLPAKNLYLGLGFHYCDTILMFYEDTGVTEFELYEYTLLKE